MSRVRVLVGTHKGAFVLSSDGKRKNWEVSGPHFGGLEIYHLKGAPGAGGMGVHTILLDPSDPQRIFVAISAAGVFRSDDGGETWMPKTRGLTSNFMPDPTAEIGHCVHRIAMHPSRPKTLF